ncbi:MAG TPA: class I SAM-dependent methyltransferase [Terriglobales bacterium]|nr:class I SAM-dependent methyltransferase [Terriglobales bacterium]
MALSRSDVQNLYTTGINHYKRFISLFQSPQAIESLLKRSTLLRPGMRVLDAGCGFGVATFALVNTLQQLHFDYARIDAFDLTPAMLSRFERALRASGVARVSLRQADVLALESLPPSWTNYDLIVSTSMLEYLPKKDFARALEVLRRRLAENGCMFVMITRKSLETKVLIEWWWGATSYARDELQRAFKRAGFEEVEFRHFPIRYFWLNRANHVVEARLRS